jgi:arsenate reductase
MILYGIANCDQVRKAQKFLQKNNLTFEFVDFKNTIPSKQILQSFIAETGWEKLVNKRSTTYRNLSVEQKQAINFELLQANLTLIKRPVLVSEAGILLGFSEKSYQTHLKLN